MNSSQIGIVEKVRERYGAIARGEASGCGCGCDSSDVALRLGYSQADLAQAGEANLGLGCGNPLALAELRPGMTILDLGSGAGFDAFLAWRQVGETGTVIGVDMTEDMLERARRNAARLGATNVEFRQGRIEKLPVDRASVDYVISNCVINLSEDKAAVFREIERVLRPGGRFAIGDLVLLRELPRDVAQSVSAYVGCIAGASPLADYIRLALAAGLTELSVPQIVAGRALAETIAPADANGDSCCPPELLSAVAGSLASIKFHGRRAV